MGELPAEQPVKPDYAGTNVVNVVPALLGRRDAAFLPDPVAGARSVVLLVLDGLGWEALGAHTPVLPTITSMTGGPATTVVPSTTPAALTSITTGQPPGRHGVTGYRIALERGVLNAIRWQRSDGKRPPEPSVFQRIAPFFGCAVPVITKSEHAKSGLTEAHLRGTRFFGWETPAVLVQQIFAATRAGEPFVYAYYSGIDEVAHAHGLHEPFYAAELAAADALVAAVLDGLADDTALVVTADHGQVHLERDAWISLGALDGLVATYAGDARFRYLHAVSGASGDLAAAAAEVVSTHGWVFTRERLFDEGWLGPDPSGPARRRRGVGDVILAACDAVGFIDPTLVRETNLRSAHGSITAREMQVPLVAARGRA